MDRFDGGRDLDDVSPNHLFLDSVGDSVAKSVGIGEVVFNDGFGKGEVIGDEYQGTVSKCTSSKGIDNGDHIAVIHSSPVFDCSNGILIRQTIA